MKLSIITINYNNLEGLRRTIESVINQTWQEFEWIIVDGGSTDGSKELIEETVASCPRISFWCSEPDKGVYNAMNKGILRAKGEYLLFLNSGDCFSCDATLNNVISFGLVKDLAYGDAEVLNPNEFLWSIPEKNVNIGWFYQGTLPHQATFFRKSLFDNFGLYDESLKIVSDWKFYSILFLSGQISYSKLPFSICKFEGNGISDCLEKRNLERGVVFRDLFMPHLLDCYAKAEGVNMIRRHNWSRFVYSILYRMVVVFEKYINKR